jgi:predicted nuclease with TOPRIM domain
MKTDRTPKETKLLLRIAEMKDELDKAKAELESAKETIEQLELDKSELEESKEQTEDFQEKLSHVISELNSRKDKLQFYKYEYTAADWMGWLDRQAKELKEAGECTDI